MTGSHAFVGLSEGTHTVEVYALDNVLNNATASVTFIVDTTAPTVTITTPSEGQFSSSSSVSVTWSGDDSGVGVQAYQYRINGGAWSSNTTETGHTFDLPDGAYTVDVRVYDRANNTATDSTAFTVDTTAPEVEISAPANGYFTNSTTVQVNWNGSDATAGVRGYQYRIDSGLWSSEVLSLSNEFSGLTDGPHTVYVQVFDRSGNMAETNVSFTVDTVGPQLGIVTPTAAQILDRSDVNVSWSSSDLTTWIAGYRYSLDGIAWSSLSMDTFHIFTGLGEGDHTVQIMAYDHEYNPSFRSVTFKVDTVDPNVAIVLPQPGQFSNSSAVGVSWTGNDPTSGLMGFHYKLDNGSWSAPSYATEHEFVGLTDGWHTVYVEAIDNASNSAMVSVTFLVDVTSPSLHITGPEDEAVVNSSQVGWAGSDPVSGILGYQYRIDGLAWSPVSNATENVFAGLSDGLHTVDVRAWDRANNSMTATVAFVYDTNAPSLTIVSPAASSGHNVSSVNVVWSAFDNTSSVIGYQFRMDNGSWSATLSTSDLFDGIADGWHIISVRAYDSAGNCAEKRIDVLVDTRAPQVIIIGPVEGQKTNSSEVRFNWTATDATSGVLGMRYRLNGGAWSALEPFASKDFMAAFDDGHYTMQVQAFDSLNNVASETVNFTVDTTAPVLTIDSPGEQSLISTPWAVVYWHASDATTGVDGYQYRIDGAEWSSPSSITSFRFASLGEGVHLVEIRAFDQAGNMMQQGVNFTVDTVAPQIIIVSPGPGTFINVSSALVSWNGTDSTTGILGYEYRVNGGQWSAMIGVLGIQLDLPDGHYSVQVRAFDRVGNTNTTSVTFVIDTVAPVPVFVSPSDGSNSNSSSVHIVWTATDVTSGVKSYLFRVDGGAWVPMEMATGITLSHLSEGQHRMELTATDMANHTATTSVNITVDTVSPVLRIVSPGNGLITNATSGSASWIGSDNITGIAGYRYRVDIGPWSAVTDGLIGSFSGLGEGNHVVHVEAFDRANNSVIVSVNFTVDSVPPMIAISAPGQGWITNHTSVAVSWNAVDATTGVLGYQYRIDGSDWSAMTTETSHVFEGVADGVHTVSVRAWDHAGNDIETSVNFTVDTVAPTFTTSPTGTGVAGNSSIKVAFSEDMDTSSVTVEIAGVNGTITWNGNELTLTPSKQLVSGHTYSAYVKGMDLAGNPASGQWTFTVMANGTVHGRIVDSTGKPIANATVSAGGKEVTTDANGEFVINLADGAYDLTVSKDGQVLASVNATTVSGQGMDLGAIKVSGTDRSGAESLPWWIVAAVLICAIPLLAIVTKRRLFYVRVVDTMTGAVLDSYGDPIENAAVTLETGQVAVTDSKGAFSFTASAGMHDVTVEKNGRMSRHIPMQAAWGRKHRTRLHRMRRK